MTKAYDKVIVELAGMDGLIMDALAMSERQWVRAFRRILPKASLTRGKRELRHRVLRNVLDDREFHRYRRGLTTI